MKMGKKGKRTRWRTLTLNGQESDSESSGTAPSFNFSKSYQPKYSKYSYSSQSTPTRKFQYEGKSTRSSSTTSEQKIIFNEDEYTRITTPRQDVLFKKGYLSKPKNYHTQTSTGTTCSTANSTSTCTPDHHSTDGAEGTDIEYESQFVFPNVFVDQNGIYYLNSLEPFPPFLVYNAAPAYYPPEYPISKTKRYSTDSAVESASPNNEEIATNGVVLDANGTPFFQQEFLQSSTTINHTNEAPQNDVQTDQLPSSNDNTKRLKKRRRKRLSTLQQSQEGPASSEHTDNYDSDEVLSQSETGSNAEESSSVAPLNVSKSENQLEENQNPSISSLTEVDDENIEKCPVENNQSCDITDDKESEKRTDEEIATKPGTDSDVKIHIDDPSHDKSSEEKSEERETDSSQISENGKDVIVNGDQKTDNVMHNSSKEDGSSEEAQGNASQLKPDAEEFVPRALRNPQHLPLNPALQFVNLPPSYMPIPIINPIGTVPPTSQQPFSPVFLPPPGMPPISIIPTPITYQSIHSNLPESVLSNNQTEEEINNSPKENIQVHDDERIENESQKITVEKINSSQAKTIQENRIDIAQIVSKLEEAAKEQDHGNPQQIVQKRHHKYSRSPQRTYYNENRQKSHGNGQKRGNYYNRRNDFSYKNYDNTSKQRLTPHQQAPRNVEPSSDNSNRLSYKKHQPQEISSENISKVENPTAENIVNRVEIKSEAIESPTGTERKNINDKKVLQSPVKYSRVVQQSSQTSQYRNRFDNRGKNSERVSLSQKNYPSPKNSANQKSESKVAQSLTTKPSTSQNQWISVSNRKKRRSKNPLTDSETEILEVSNEEKPSEAVVDATEPNETLNSSVVISDDVVIDQIDSESSIMVHIDQNVPIDITECPVLEEEQKIETQVVIEVTVNPPEEPVLIVHEFPVEEIIINGAEATEDDVLSVSENKTIELNATKSEKKSQSKNSKKNQKTQHRKVMITDPDTSYTQHTASIEILEEFNSKIKEIEEGEIVNEGLIGKDNVAKSTENELGSKEDTKVEIITTVQKDTEENLDKSLEGGDKKLKKKKKKQTSKSNLNKNRSASNSSTILNLDDPYNFLLDDVILKDADNKTNEEVSEELDRLIQKGMYSSLEGKLKTIGDSKSMEDQFFKMFTLDNSTQKKQTQNTTNPIKITDLALILKNSVFGGRNVEKSQQQQIETTFPQVKFPNVEDLPQPSTSRSGFFLENPETTELIKTMTNNTVDVEPPVFQICMVEHHPNVKSKSSNKLKCKNKKSKTTNEPNLREDFTINEETEPGTCLTNGCRYNNDSEDSGLKDESDDMVLPLENGKETLYPITQAVKEWMTKTRENTPDVEILKSPDVILKEFIEADSELETEMESVKISNGYSKHNGTAEENKISQSAEEELTLFSANDDWSLSPQTSIEDEDLLECWDNEMSKNANDTKAALNGKKMNGSLKNCTNGFLDEDGIIEDYESKYGKNEDYLKLKAEIEEQKKHLNFPKHGNLPYRAICCNVM